MPRRAAALLMVLIAVVLIMAVLSAALQATQESRIESIWSEAQRHQLDALAIGERLTKTWLHEHAGGVVLPPSGDSLLLCNDAVACDNDTLTVQVELYDGLAGVPAHLFGPKGPLGLAVPTEVVGCNLDNMPRGSTEQVSAVLEWCPELPSVRFFPQARMDAIPVQWAADGTWLVPAAFPTPGEPQASVAWATVLAPHSDGRININTANETLLRQAYAVLKIDGVDDVLAARSRGKASGIVEAVKRPDGLRLVSSSDCWNALISTGWNGYRRAWWVVLTGKSDEFRILQRHDANR